MLKKISVALILLFLLGVGVSEIAQAAMPENCPMHQNKAEVKPSGNVMVNIVKAITPNGLLQLAFATSESNKNKAVGDNCPHQQAVNSWRQWRKRNPNAKSKFADEPPSLVSLPQRFGPEPYYEDPEPDPGFGGCGCPPDVALASGGCGWWHANVYDLKKIAVINKNKFLIMAKK